MRLLGLVSLLVALAIVGVAVSRQLQAVGRVPSSAASAAPPAPPAANVREASQQLQEQVRRDVTKALEQGARREEPAQ